MTPSGASNGKAACCGTGSGHGPSALFARYSGVLDEVHGAYQTLETLSRSQEELVERDDADELLDLLARRQELVNRLSELDRTFVLLRLEWDQASPNASPAQREQINTRLEAINALARWVAHRDTAATHRLERRREALAEELSGLNRSKSAREAYAPSAAAGARFQDREG